MLALISRVTRLFGSPQQAHLDFAAVYAIPVFTIAENRNAVIVFRQIDVSVRANLRPCVFPEIILFETALYIAVGATAICNFRKNIGTERRFDKFMPLVPIRFVLYVQQVVFKRNRLLEYALSERQSLFAHGRVPVELRRKYPRHFSK